MKLDVRPMLVPDRSQYYKNKLPIIMNIYEPQLHQVGYPAVTPQKF